MWTLLWTADNIDHGDVKVKAKLSFQPIVIPSETLARRSIVLDLAVDRRDTSLKVIPRNTSQLPSTV